MFNRVARGWMMLRECIVPTADKQREREEAVLANLYTCLEQLHARTQDMENKVAQCSEQAMGHMRVAKNTPSSAIRQRERQRAKLCMEERRRMQAQLDKATLMRGAIQTQIDNIMSSHMDMLIVDTMRGFNYATKDLALEARTSDIEALGADLSERQSEVSAMQDAIMGIGTTMAAMAQPTQYSSMDQTADDDRELWAELDALMQSDDAPQPRHDRRRASVMPGKTADVTPPPAAKEPAGDETSAAVPEQQATPEPEKRDAPGIAAEARRRKEDDARQIAATSAMQEKDDEAEDPAKKNESDTAALLQPA